MFLLTGKATGDLYVEAFLLKPGTKAKTEMIKCLLVVVTAGGANFLF